MIRAGFFAAGFKGTGFVHAMLQECEPQFVVSYPVKGTLDDSYQQLTETCKRSKIPCLKPEHVDAHRLAQAQIIFVAGWQRVLTSVDTRFVLLHDALLPRLRGFNPTVTALINGDTTMGVSALELVEKFDCGRLYGQVSVHVAYPLRIKDAYLKLIPCYKQAACDIIAALEHGAMPRPVKQNEALATYSLWRDAYDYQIDWNQDAQKIARFIDAVGWPYLGARASLGGKTIIIDEAQPIENIVFENRVSGKIWSIDKHAADVVCGDGMLRIKQARYEDGTAVHFTRVRERLA